jgi:tetratricopeptide (TPR) repeat protein
MKMNIVRLIVVSLFSCALVAVGQTNETELFNKAQFLLLKLNRPDVVVTRDSQDVKEAVGYLQDFARLYPDSRKTEVARSHLARLYVRIGDYDPAALGYRSLIAEYSSSTERDNWEFELCSIRMLRGDYQGALIDLRSFQAKFSTQKSPSQKDRIPDAQVMALECLIRLGKFGEIDPVFQQFIANYPGHPAVCKAVDLVTGVYASNAQKLIDRDSDAVIDEYKKVLDTYSAYSMSSACGGEQLEKSYLALLPLLAVRGPDAVTSLLQDVLSKPGLARLHTDALRRLSEMRKE